MVIDLWILEAINISSALPEGSFHSILIPEFKSSRLRDEPARIQYGKHVTSITGSTDYALWSVVSIEFRRHYEGILSRSCSVSLAFIFNL